MRRWLRDEWVKALRSGVYRQTVGKLRKGRRGDYRHCCLGVLCEVAGLPKRSWLGRGFIPKKLVTMNGHLLQRSLASMNDEGVSFSKIADWIEKNVPVWD